MIADMLQLQLNQGMISMWSDELIKKLIAIATVAFVVLIISATL